MPTHMLGRPYSVLPTVAETDRGSVVTRSDNALSKGLSGSELLHPHLPKESETFLLLAVVLFVGAPLVRLSEMVFLTLDL